MHKQKVPESSLIQVLPIMKTILYSYLGYIFYLFRKIFFYSFIYYHFFLEYVGTSLWRFYHFYYLCVSASFPFLQRCNRFLLNIGLYFFSSKRAVVFLRFFVVI